jgi:hypothetical protein
MYNPTKLLGCCTIFSLLQACSQIHPVYLETIPAAELEKTKTACEPADRSNNSLSAKKPNDQICI